MDKRKIANQKVKDRLFAALIEFAGSKDWSRLTVTELIEQSGVARAGGTGGKHSETFRYGRHVFRSHQSGSA